MSFDRLDACLAAANPESMDWADGGGWEAALEPLSEFTDNDWDRLEAVLNVRSSDWRTSLAELLTPVLGDRAAKVVLQLTADDDPGVAFVALCQVLFHCGVNRGPDGAFEDPKIVNEDFLARVRADEAFRRRLPNYDDFLVDARTMLAEILDRQPA